MQRGQARQLAALLVVVAAALLVLALMAITSDEGYDTWEYLYETIAAGLAGAALLALIAAAVLVARPTPPPIPRPSRLRSAAAQATVAGVCLVLAVVLLATGAVPLGFALAPLVPAALYAVKALLIRQRPA